MREIQTFQITIPYTGLERRVWVYLPAGYNESSKSYPVLYMHDGQNLFDPETSYAGVTWQVGETLDQLTAEGRTEGVIVVGVDNAGDGAIGRFEEYSPWINT